MKSLLSHDRSWAYRSLLLLTLLTLAVGLWGRLYDLGFPAKEMWDEIYFPVMAGKYLTDTFFFDLHPPLGKFIIAVSIALFGDTPVAWRLMPTVFGIALLPLGFFLGWSSSSRGWGPCCSPPFLAGETILIVHSRPGSWTSFSCSSPSRPFSRAGGGAQGAGDLACGAARRGHQHQVGSPARGHPRWLRALAQGAASPVSGRAVVRRPPLHRDRLRRAAHHRDRQPRAGVGRGMGVAPAGGPARSARPCPTFGARRGGAGRSCSGPYATSMGPTPTAR
jgi:hypothetical protein